MKNKIVWSSIFILLLMLVTIVFPITDGITITKRKTFGQTDTFFTDTFSNTQTTSSFEINAIVYDKKTNLLADYKYNVAKTKDKEYSSGKLVKMKVDIHNIHIALGPFYIDQHYIAAKTKSYEKKHFLLWDYWKAYKTVVKAQVGGTVEVLTINDTWQMKNCSSLLKSDNNNNEIDAKVFFNGYIMVRVQRNWIYGYFYCNGNSETIWLDW
jgi:hypothetical protein